MLERYAKLLCRYPLWVVIAVLSVTVTLGLGLRRLHVEVDPDEQLPQDHPYVRAFHRVHDLFGDWNLAVIAIEPRDGNILSQNFLNKIASITRRIGEVPGCNPALLQSITSSRTKYIALDRDTLRIEALLPEVPTATTNSIGLLERLTSNPEFRGTLVSKDLSAFAIYATFELTPALPGYVDINTQIESVLHSEDDGSFSFQVSGPIPLVSAISSYSSSILTYLPITLLVIGLLHYHGFRSLQAAFLPLLTGLLAVTWSLGLMGHVGVPLDPLNSTTALLVLAIGAGHAVQILKRYQEELHKGEDVTGAIIATIEAIGGVTLATGLIAALSFLSLSTLGTSSIRQFGLFTGFGIAAAVTIELSLIPALRTLLPPRRTLLGKQPLTHRLLRCIARITTGRSGAIAVLAGYGVILLISILLAVNIHVDTSLKRTLSPDAPVRQADDFVNEMFSGTNSLILLIEGPREGDIARPDTLNAIVRLQRQIEALPGVGKTLSIADQLLQLHRTINATKTAEALPTSGDLIAQYLLLYSMAGGDDLGSRMTPDNRVTKVLVLLHDDSTLFAKEVIARTTEIARNTLPADISVTIAGSAASNVALSDTLVKGKLLNVAQISLITTIISAVFLSSIVGGLLVAPPLTVAVMINLGTMGALGVPLDVTTAAVTAMSVGIGADYALYFVYRYREECATHEPRIALQRTILTTGHAILLVSSAIAAGYSVLCLSGFRMFVQLGGFVALAMLSSSLAALVVTPAALTLLPASTVGFAPARTKTPNRSDSSGEMIARRPTRVAR